MEDASSPISRSLHLLSNGSVVNRVAQCRSWISLTMFGQSASPTIWEGELSYPDGPSHFQLLMITRYDFETFIIVQVDAP